MITVVIPEIHLMVNRVRLIMVVARQGVELVLRKADIYQKTFVLIYLI